MFHQDFSPEPANKTDLKILLIKRETDNDKMSMHLASTSQKKWKRWWLQDRKNELRNTLEQLETYKKQKKDFQLMHKPSSCDYAIVLQTSE